MENNIMRVRPEQQMTTKMRGSVVILNIIQQLFGLDVIHRNR